MRRETTKQFKMSEFTHDILEKYKDRVRVDTSHCPQYIRRQVASEKDTVLTVHLPYDCLREWRGAREKASGQQIPCSYVDMLNIFLFEKTGFKVRSNCQRIEGRLGKLCGEIRSKFVGKNGTTYRKLCLKESRVALQLDDLETLSELENELTTKNDELKKRYDNLFKDITKSKDAERMANTEINELRTENHKLQTYVEGLGQELAFKNNGRKLSCVGDRQQRRKLVEIKSNVGQALWFSKTFGLNLETVIFSDDQNAKHSLCYSEKDKTSYKDLSDEGKEKVKCVLFILDKFCIADAAYHELTMTCDNDSLPKSYLIKQCKEELNSLWKVSPTPGPAEGAQLDFMTQLESVIQKMIQQGTIDTDDPDLVLKIKLSGDGAKTTRLTNFVVISFSVLNNPSDVMSSKGHHTIAIVKGHESYELLKKSCSDVFLQFNKLAKSKKVNINGKEIPVEVYVGGDYKFLLLLLGMKSATSDYACIWCKIHKKDRSDMSKPKEFYWGSLARSIMEMQMHAASNKFSCAHQPLVSIPLENVVLDELHLMLRITDKLTKNLVMEMDDWDKEDNLSKRPMARTNMHMDSLVNAINSCGVSFNVWQKMDGNGQESGLMDFTSLTGSDKKLLLQKLPSKLENVVKPETGETVIKLWKDFCELYELVQIQDPTSDKILDYFNKATRWVNLFTSLGGIAIGYDMARVTPYMHSMVYHVPRFLERHQGIKKFTGQGVEKLNDDCRRVHLQRSNKWDAAKDVLVVGNRVEHLADCERSKRQYVKQDQSYWDTGIVGSRTKRPRISIIEPIPEEPSHIDLDNLGLPEIKQMLKDLGVLTKLRSRKKLQELLLDNLNNNKENAE